MTSSVTVLQPGPLSTIQDLGRVGYQRLGVPVGGAMDAEALVLGNRLVGNAPGAAAIEVTIGAASFEFSNGAILAVTGGDLGPTLDGLRVPTWTTFAAPAGSAISFGSPAAGLRAYLCVAGGVASIPQLGSRSTHVGSGLGGLHGAPLRTGDLLPLGDPVAEPLIGSQVPAGLRPVYGTLPLVVRVVAGPQSDAFSELGLKRFYESEYVVTDRSDRQGIRFDGPRIETSAARYDIVSDAVPVGSVQVPGDGKPIVLMADRQTTGGYVKIAVVATVDLPLLAQAPPGTTVRFAQIDVEEAQRLLRDRRAQIFERPLAAPRDSIELEFAVDGSWHVVRVDGLAAGGPDWIPSVGVDGNQVWVHAASKEDETR